MFNPMNLDQQAVDDRVRAIDGICPEARVVSTQAELAAWFRSVSVAAGVIARTKDAGTV